MALTDLPGPTFILFAVDQCKYTMRSSYIV